MSQRMFVVSVTTNDSDLDTLDDQTLMNEIEQNLLYEAYQYGIVRVSVMSVAPTDLSADCTKGKGWPSVPVLTWLADPLKGYGHGI